MMRRVSWYAALLLASAPLFGSELEVGIRYVSKLPNESTFDGGLMEIGEGRGFAVTAELFLTPHASLQLAGTFSNPRMILFPAASPAHIDLNTMGIAAYTLSARYHLSPSRRFSPFAGAGGALVTFGNLEERFADTIEMELENQTTWLLEAGIRYRFRPQLFLDAAVSYTPLESDVVVVRNDAALSSLPPHLSIDLVTVSVGAAWRF